MDDEGVVDVDKEGQFLFSTHGQQLHALKLDSEITVPLEVQALGHGLVINCLVKSGDPHGHNDTYLTYLKHNAVERSLGHSND